MNSSDKIPVFALVFGIAYAVIYVICTELNLPLLTYNPAIVEVGILWQPLKSGPAMYWYGWMLTSALGALAVAFIAIAIPEPWLQRLITFGCVAATAYLVLYTLALFIHILGAIGTFIGVSVWLFAAMALRSAHSVGQVRALTSLIQPSAVLAIVSILLLGVAGFHLAITVWRERATWIIVATISFVLLESVMRSPWWLKAGN